jgi:hypothetical protein
VKIVIGCVHGEELNSWFVHSLLKLWSWERTHPDSDTIEFLNLGDHVMVRSGPALAMGRGTLIGTFLDNTDGDALFMVDADMAFEPQTLVSMSLEFQRLQVVENGKVGFLGGLAFISNDPRHASPRPNIWGQNPEIPGNLIALQTYEADALYELAATGGACLMISRQALEDVRAGHPESNSEKINPFHHLPIVDWHMLARACHDKPIDEAARIMRNVVYDADQLGEDLSFCVRLRDKGYKLYEHTGLRFDHAKSTLVGEPEHLAAVARHEAEQSALEAQKEAVLT